VLLGACDTFRAGAVRQLEIWAERLGVEVVKGQQGGDPRRSRSTPVPPRRAGAWTC
jgi:signal recognition particle GTPase